MKHRYAVAADLPLLGRLNRELIEDEGSDNSMTIAELEQRMRRWLSSEHRAVLFEIAAEPIGYALFQPDEYGVYLRHFFICRGFRRSGHGRRSMDILRTRILPKDCQVTLDVLEENETGMAFWQAVGFSSHARKLKART
jgi:GNAT superfamily N-acetyltransferase